MAPSTRADRTRGRRQGYRGAVAGHPEEEPVKAAGRVGWAASLMLAALAVGALSPAPALAHSELTSSTPADSAVLRAAPRQVTLVFGESVQAGFSRIAVTGPDGSAAGAGAITTTGARLIQPISATEPGPYTVSYRVVSRDGHVVQGRLRFSVSPPPVSVSSVPAPSPTAAGSPTPAVPSTSAADPGQRNGSGWGSLVVLGPMVLALTVIAVLLARTPRRPILDADDAEANLDDGRRRAAAAGPGSTSVSAAPSAREDEPT